MSIPARVELRVVALDEIFLGTARPSVITVLRSLATRGLVTRDGDSWLLSHLSRHALSALTCESPIADHERLFRVNEGCGARGHDIA